VPGQVGKGAGSQQQEGKAFAVTGWTESERSESGQVGDTRRVRWCGESLRVSLSEALEEGSQAKGYAGR